MCEEAWPTHDWMRTCVYLLLYGGQQVFEDCQLGHEVLQLLVSTLVHRLTETWTESEMSVVAVCGL